MISERDVLTLWRQLFVGQTITTGLLKKADALLDGLSTESPLRVRLSKELEDIRKLPQNAQPEQKSRARRSNRAESEVAPRIVRKSARDVV